jgi:hypothetical protein
MMQNFKGHLEASLPDGWVGKESITLLAPDGQANVIASSEPLDADVNLDTYVGVQGELLSQEFPQYEQIALKETEMLGGDRRGYFRRFDWTPPDGRRISQYQLYYVESGRGYTMTATAEANAFLRYEAELLGILQSVHLVP